MSTRTSTSETCPEEGGLLLHLDGEIEPSARGELKEHLTGCPTCRERLAALEDRSDAVATWIRRHDPEPPPRHAYDLTPRRRTRKSWGRHEWAAAAAIVVAAATLLTPLRGLIAEELLRPVGSWVEHVLSGGDEGTDQVVAGDPAARAASPGTAFAHHGAELTLLFESGDTEGTLTVEPAGDSLVTLWSARAEVSLSVRPGVVEVGNREMPAGDYRIAVPSTLRRLRLRVADGGESVVELGGLAGSRAVVLPHPSPSGGLLP